MATYTKATQNDLYEMFDAIIAASGLEDATLEEAMLFYKSNNLMPQLVDFLRDVRTGLGFDVTEDLVIELTDEMIAMQNNITPVFA